ncbi:MAG TPA: hypothetical protein VIJ70_00435 [Gaiellaceae bacterium]
MRPAPDEEDAKQRPQHGQEHRRVGDRDRVGESGSASEAVAEEHRPHEQAEGQCQDSGIDVREPVAADHCARGQQHEADDRQQATAEVEGVGK